MARRLLCLLVCPGYRTENLIKLEHTDKHVGPAVLFCKRTYTIHRKFGIEKDRERVFFCWLLLFFRLIFFQIDTPFFSSTENFAGAILGDEGWGWG